MGLNLLSNNIDSDEFLTQDGVNLDLEEEGVLIALIWFFDRQKSHTLASKCWSWSRYNLHFTKRHIYRPKIMSFDRHYEKCSSKICQVDRHKRIYENWIQLIEIQL